MFTTEGGGAVTGAWVVNRGWIVVVGLLVVRLVVEGLGVVGLVVIGLVVLLTELTHRTWILWGHLNCSPYAVKCEPRVPYTSTQEDG